jgi:hypothetical protein
MVVRGAVGNDITDPLWSAEGKDVRREKETDDSLTWGSHAPQVDGRKGMKVDKTYSLVPSAGGSCL